MTGLHALLIMIALADGDPLPRPISALETASVTDGSRLRELLLSRQRPAEQSQAALLLVQSPLPEAEEIVRSGLRRQDRPDVFQSLAAAIRLRRDTRFIEPMLSALGSEQSAIRQSAEETLACLDANITSRKLLALAEDSQATPLARQSAVASLGRSMQKPAAIALMSLLSSESKEVHQAVVTALESLTGQNLGTDTFRWQEWWDQQKDLTDEEWLAARTAYMADRARRLRDDLQQAENQIVKLHQSLYAKVLPADRPQHLRTLAGSEYPAVRGQAVAWIGELLSDEGIDRKPLIALLLTLSDDGVEAVQRQAVLALEKVNDPKAFERLLTLLRIGNVTVRAAAARSLSRYGNGQGMEVTQRNAQAVAALEKALADPSLVVVAEAAESLGSLGVPEAAPILAGLLRHPSDQVRQAAARGLEPLGSPAIISELFAGLDDPLATVRFSLVGALAKAGAADGIGENRKADLRRRLEKVLLRDSDPGVRSRAAGVIGDLGTSAELPILWQRVIAPEDNRVQVKAWTAMIEIIARSGNMPLVGQWDHYFHEQSQGARRVEMLTETRNRWLKLESAKPHLDALTSALVQAQLAQRKWNLALPLARELAKKAPNEAELKKSLRWLLLAGRQAVEDKQAQEALEMIKDVEQLMKRAEELGPEFEALRQEAIARL